MGPSGLLRACAAEPYPLALVGAGPGSWASGMSVVGCAPRAVLTVTGAGAAVVRGAGGDERCSGHPLDVLEGFVGRFSDPLRASDADLGFVAVALSYDLRHHIERLRSARPAAADAVLVHAAAYDWLVVYDDARRRCELRRRPGAEVDLDAVAADLRQRVARATRRSAAGCHLRLVPEGSAADHRRAVERALAYIAAGDIYQVNVAQRFRAEGRTDAVALFATLQSLHPVPFGAYLDTGAGVLVSNSPECFLRLDGRQVATFPIKGTRPRAAGAAADRAQERALAVDPKELAEHVMIVDLERNDLGRVCAIGSVAVRDLLHVESFPSLHHLVSEVRGELRPGVGLAALLRATFPGGSITGAPKVRAMEIIDEIEPCGRGFYTGAIGLVGSGWARWNIAIRTAFVTPGALVYHSGGGIVADSDPRREYDEILLKAQPLAAALQASAA